MTNLLNTLHDVAVEVEADLDFCTDSMPKTTLFELLQDYAEALSRDADLDWDALKGDPYADWAVSVDAVWLEVRRATMIDQAEHVLLGHFALYDARGELAYTEAYGDDGMALTWVLACLRDGLDLGAEYTRIIAGYHEALRELESRRPARS